MINWKTTIEETLVEENDENSHTEIDPNTFHPSQISKCERQCYLSKLGLVEHPPETLGGFITGTLIHEWLEEYAQPKLPNHVFEVSVNYEDAGIRWKGHTDCWDTANGILYDFKTTGAHNCSQDNFYYVDEDGNDSHLDQLTIYMRSLEVEKAKVVYICKKNPTHVREWPEDDPYTFDWERYHDLNRKARRIEKVLREEGLPEAPHEIPFEKCGCWLCEKENTDMLVFPKGVKI